MKIDKSGFKDTLGRYITQGLFLEPQLDPTFAVFTMQGEDRVYKGKTYISLKKLYLEMADPIEYEFATTYLYDWDHWKRMESNAFLMNNISKWREELELKLASEGFRAILDQSEDNYQASKWLAERGWSKRGAGRPKKELEASERKLQEHLDNEFAGDVVRMDNYR